MSIRTRDVLNRLSSGRNVLVLLIILAAFSLSLMQPMYSRIETLSNGVGAIDILFSYTPERAYRMVSEYGAQGRRYYATLALTLDAIFPLILALTFAATIAYVFRRAFPGQSGVWKLALFPLAPMVADYAENAGIAAMLLSYPRELTTIAQLTSTFSTAKWILVGVESALIAAGGISWGYQRLFSRRNPD